MSAPLIVTIVSAKGGSGATTVATELAYQFRKNGMSKVAIVDADLTGRRNMAVILDVMQKLDTARIEGPEAIAEVEEGLCVVELTYNRSAAFLLDAERIARLYEKDLREFSAIVIDAPEPWATVLRPVILETSRFLVVEEPNLLGTNGARGVIGDLRTFGVPPDRIALVTNNRTSRVEIRAKDLERILDTKVVAELRNISSRAFRTELEKLADLLVSAPPEAPMHLISWASSKMADRRAPRKDRREQNGRASDTGTPVESAAPAVLPSPPRAAIAVDAAPPPSAPRLDALKIDIYGRLSDKMSLVASNAAYNDAQKMAALRQRVEEITVEAVREYNDLSLSAQEITLLKAEIVDDALGLGPLEEIMRNPAVSEIMVNGPDVIYVERNGKLTLTDRHFVDVKHLRTVIERILAPLGRRIDESSPMVDGRLADGSRVNAIISPIALKGTCVTIRRFGTKALTMDDLLKFGAVNSEVVALLRAFIEARCNIVVSGGTGSGKTTFLNILSGYISHDERIVTIEDAAELRLSQHHVVTLEARPANLDGKGAVTIRDLVKNSLRMRPDRIIVGECRGGEALDMLQAMNTGHDGSLTTTHANTPREAIARLETLVLMSGFDLPIRAIREQIAGAIDVIVQTQRFRDGSRKIVSVTEIVGMEGEVVTLQEIVRYQQKGMNEDGKVIGEFFYTGVQPNAMKRFEEKGVDYDVRELGKMAAAGGLW